MAAPLNPNSADPHYTKLLSELFPIEKRGKDPALRTFDLILAGDSDGLKQWVSDPAKGAERVNGVATKMFLHPLHVCAMTGSLACARVLIETEVCQINPQDASKATPCHHAAVRNHQAMIALFSQNKASPLLDRFGASWATVLRQIQPPKPETQVFWYQNKDGVIVKGNGHDFARLTGASFVDKDCQITPEEWLNLWRSEAEDPDSMPPNFVQRYEAFIKNPPQLSQAKHDAAGFDVRAKQKIHPGMIVGEYLGDYRQGAGRIKPRDYLEKSLEEIEKRSEYIYEDVDATHTRGIIPMCNDSFPNTRAFRIFNQRGIPIRTVLVAIAPIEPGDSIVFFYGLGHSIRFAQRVELRKEAFITYFKQECAGGLAHLVNKGMDFNDTAIRQNRLPEAEENMPLQAFLYAFTTPSAILHLLCENVIQIKELRDIFAEKEVLNAIKAMTHADSCYRNWRRLENFYQTAFNFFDRVNDLKTRARIGELKRLREAIDHSDLNGLIRLMGGDPQAANDVDAADLLELFGQLLEVKK